MPRLPPFLVRYASGRSGHLADLLGQCRTLESASNELRWLKEHATKAQSQPQCDTQDATRRRLADLVKRRARGEPLQYILGDQPFGDLAILCRPKVLIPRTDTETYTTAVAEALKKLQFLKPGTSDGGTATKSLRVLDLCCGSGCISLLLHRLLKGDSSETTFEIAQSKSDIQILGIDLSPDALQLSKDNLAHNLGLGTLHPSAANEVIFRDADIMTLGAGHDDQITEPFNGFAPGSGDVVTGSWDVLISNPPYVSPKDHAAGGPTERSVRKFEPEMALVPPATSSTSVDRADSFYPHILRIARGTGVKLVVMEIGDADQARRVRNLAREELSDVDGLLLETWYDDDKVISFDHDAEVEDPNGQTVPAVGARAVVVWLADWGQQRQITYGGQ